MVSITATAQSNRTPSPSTGLRRLLGKKRSNPDAPNAKGVLEKSTSASSFGTASTVSTSGSSTLSLASSISNPRMDRRVTADFPALTTFATNAADEEDSSQRYFDDGCDDGDIANEEISATSPNAEEDATNDDDDDGTAATDNDEISIASSTPSCTRTRRRVHFDETVAIGSIPLLEEYTPAELEAMYYSTLDEDNLRAEAKYIVKSIRMARMQKVNGHPTAASTRILEGDHEDYCPRGLENYLLTKEEKRVRKAEARGVILSVLLAQEEQRESLYGAHEDHRKEAQSILAVASVTRSRRSRATAIEVALQDEEEVRKMIEIEERERCDREQKEDEQQQDKALPNDTTNTNNTTKPIRGKAARRMSAAASNIASKVVRKASSSIIVNDSTRRRKTTPPRPTTARPSMKAPGRHAHNL